MDYFDLELKNTMYIKDTINKPLHKDNKPNITKNKKQKFEITYENFINGNLELRSYKVNELKEMAKQHSIKLGGKKEDIINRISKYFLYYKNAIIIQRRFRKWIVWTCYKLRGPAYLNKSPCINETDLFTMEPIVEIPNEYFYSFRDINDVSHIYGFNITSLVKYIKMNKIKGSKILLQNPYNRKDITDEIITDIIHLYNLCFILYPSFKIDNERFRVTHKQPTTTTHNIRIPSTFLHYTPNIYHIIFNDEITARYNNICEIRTKTFDQRSNEIFMEMDRLGNYTNVNWFLNLESIDYINLYGILNDIWYSKIPRDIRMKICPFHSPFEGLFTRQISIVNLSLEELRLTCLIIFENFIYSGIDEDHRKLGTFHALSGLTVVSREARASMMWLYESLVIT